MVYEYALEPDLVATWCNRLDFRYFVTKFGLGEGRMVSRYPKPWKRLVWEAFKSGDDMDRKRIEEIIIRIAERMIIRRDYHWDQEKPWLINAENEHQRCPFHAVLARTNPNKHHYVLIADDLGEESSTLWVVQRGLTVQRKAVDMAAAVYPMLSNCTTLILIDPHFGPENVRHRLPLKEFFKALFHNRKTLLPTRVEVQTSVKSESGFFRRTCEECMPAILPKGLTVRFIRWKERSDGEKLHNRYVLTDIGGVNFNIGLDEGKKGETDDVLLLSRKQYEMRWSQYASDNTAFDLVDYLDIEGQCEF